jgi:hypothetical protein
LLVFTVGNKNLRVNHRQHRLIKTATALGV